uniref:T. congolense-specific, cell surface-expressed gene family n=1 Tax=Trypanosoma congolense (strain IL3000) TaxID=1068625 RepID=G0V2E1_TRYCI|nr:hypothetical protein, unlikely [Trypanosoma congolense IL3000]
MSLVLKKKLLFLLSSSVCMPSRMKYITPTDCNRERGEYVNIGCSTPLPAQRYNSTLASRYAVNIVIQPMRSQLIPTFQIAPPLLPLDICAFESPGSLTRETHSRKQQQEEKTAKIYPQPLLLLLFIYSIHKHTYILYIRLL